VRPASGEGNIASTLYNVNIKNFDKGQWPGAKRIGQLREQLASTTGVPVADILTEIAQRQNGIITPPPAYGNQAHADIPADQKDEDDDENLYQW